jgi:DNA-binding transcriptional ArsR family regulator
VEILRVYSCFSDRTRLRILNLLTFGPLCVCHFQQILREPQVKISKHLGLLRRNGLVAATREGNWMIYSLPAKPTRELRAQLACLQEIRDEEPVLQGDLRRLERSRSKLVRSSPICCVLKARVQARVMRIASATYRKGSRR